MLCSSFDEFQDRFGGFTVDADLPLAAMGFFENGGSQLWVVRTMHYGDVSDASSALGTRASGFLAAGGGPTPASVQGANSGPFRLTDGSLIRAVVDGGAPQDAVFIGSAATVAAGGARPFALADGMNLLLRFDGGAEQEVVFAAADFGNIALATPPEVAAVLNRVLVGARASVTAGILQVQSDTLGLASQAQIVGGTANTVLQFPDATVSGGGNVPNLAAVDVLDVRAVVEAAIPTLHVVEGPGGQVVLETVGTGPTATLEVDAATSAAFGFDAALHAGAATGAARAVQVEGKDPGAYGNRLEVEVRAATNGSADAFDLLVIEDGVYREVFPNLSMTETHPRYVETVVNNARTGSLYIRVTDQRLLGAPVPHPQTITLSGGNDGLLALGDADFIGSEAGHTGLHALDAVQDLSLLIVPGRATPAIHDAMLRYCEVTRNGMAFAVLDPPASLSAPDIVTYVTTTASLENLSEYGAIYWPRIEVLNPQKSVYGNTERIVAPPSGAVAGAYARTDGERPGGVYDPPAGIDKGRLFGVLGFETDEVLDERKRDLVYPHRINPLTTAPGLPRYIDGSRTLKGDGNFPYVAERRGVIFIERSLRLGLEFARHKNNTEALRAQVRRTITAFLLTQMNNGAFRSREPAKAFFVDMSANTPTVIFAGQLIARVGLATNKPAEFIILRISQDTRALEAELADSNP